MKLITIKSGVDAISKGTLEAYARWRDNQMPEAVEIVEQIVTDCETLLRQARALLAEFITMRDRP